VRITRATDEEADRDQARRGGDQHDQVGSGAGRIIADGVQSCRRTVQPVHRRPGPREERRGRDIPTDQRGDGQRSDQADHDDRGDTGHRRPDDMGHRHVAWTRRGAGAVGHR